ncbi:lipopolysaccharide biosynthesis protein [Alicycliphilus denitrificans]|uniref:lipopolysaccharide biosynthesis protein n=1 Tax=Alicycliphilus denitrificans TaxID=179636 RepID=UPI00384D5C1B
MPHSTQTKIAKGAIWMILFRLIERGLGLISTLILARLLMPEDFGVVAMAMSFIAMAELLSAFNFDTAIIQNQSATHDHYNSAWTCSLLLGLCITLLMIALAVPIATFYRRPELTWVVVALAFGPLFTGAQNIGVVAFLKELNFRREFKFQVFRKLISFSVVVPLAFLLRSYWALVVGILVSKLGGTLISYLMHPYRPRLDFSKARELLFFSRWLLINNVAGFLKERGADFFVGRMTGATSLGTYNIAYELANLPTTEIGAPINRALLPGFARMSSQVAVSDAYSNAVGILALVTLPIAASIHALAPYLVPLMLGNKWLGAVPLMQLLAFNGVLVLLHSSICAVLIGRGFPARAMYANLVYTVMLLLLLAGIFLHDRSVGVIGAAYAALLTSLLSTPIYLHQLHRCLGLHPLLFVKIAARPVVASACLILMVQWITPSYYVGMSFASILIWFVAGSIVALCTYLVAILLMWHVAGRPAGAEQILRQRMIKEWSQRFKLRTSSNQV